MSNVAVIVGRFQTHKIHKGYEYLFNEITKKPHDRLLVFVGIPFFGMSKKNPLDFQQREYMIREYIVGQKYGVGKDIPFSIIPVPDNFSDIEWSNNLDKLIASATNYGDKITLYQGRDGFGDHYHGKHRIITLDDEIEWSSTKDRSNIEQSPVLTQDFRAGVIYANQKVFPHAKSVVDVAVVKDDFILMGRKAGEDKWRCVGGFADVEDDCLEATVIRELKEETGLNVYQQPIYLGSFKVKDYRLRNITEYSIMTSLFLVKNPLGEPKADDDLVEVKWFDRKDILDNTREEHKQLIIKVLCYLYDNK